MRDVALLLVGVSASLLAIAFGLALRRWRADLMQPQRSAVAQVAPAPRRRRRRIARWCPFVSIVASACATIEPHKMEYLSTGTYRVTLVVPGSRIQDAEALLTATCRGNAARLGCRVAKLESAVEGREKEKDQQDAIVTTTTIVGTLSAEAL